jgi:hypothetical protein
MGRKRKTKEQIVIGEESCLETSKKKMDKVPLEVGDIVAQYSFYSNGKPMQPKDWDYLADSENIGLVVGERYHSGYKATIITVKFPKREVIYIKERSGSFLVKLS